MFSRKYFKCFLRNERRRFKKMRKMRGFNLNGCKVELYNNHRYSFRFEYKIVPYRPYNFRFALMDRKVKGQITRVIHDPSSMPTLKGCIYYAKDATEFFRTRAQMLRW